MINITEFVKYHILLYIIYYVIMYIMFRNQNDFERCAKCHFLNVINTLCNIIHIDYNM